MHLLTDIANLIRSWWRSDSIRVSPTTGRLLQLRTGSRVLIFGNVFTVEKRIDSEFERSGNVSYLLQDGEADCYLNVTRQIGNLRWRGTLSSEGNERPVFDDDIVILRSNTE